LGCYFSKPDGTIHVVYYPGQPYNEVLNTNLSLHTVLDFVDNEISQNVLSTKTIKYITVGICNATNENKNDYVAIVEADHQASLIYPGTEQLIEYSKTEFDYLNQKINLGNVKKYSGYSRDNSGYYIGKAHANLANKFYHSELLAKHRDEIDEAGFFKTHPV